MASCGPLTIRQPDGGNGDGGNGGGGNGGNGGGGVGIQPVIDWFNALPPLQQALVVLAVGGGLLVVSQPARQRLPSISQVGSRRALPR